jgi:rhamnose utilization protein RhaD (predicted bifunctional aldolase and dehydrogenase)
MRHGATQEAFQAGPSDIESLLDLSARIGRDPLLAHASSGNTSLKHDGTLWVKASGKWLAYADQQEILVPVGLAESLECLEQGRPLPGHNGCQWQTHLRPSIETFMHAVLPQRVVIHVHSVDTIAWAVRSDAPVQLEDRLSGLGWQWIPYVASGMPLAREVQIASSACPHTDVYVLGNHGLVVCGDDCSSAESLLAEVQRRLNRSPRALQKPEYQLLEHVQDRPGWRLPDLEALHALATDVVSLGILKGGVLYPCQAIFLGRTLPLLPFPTPVPEVSRRIHALDESPPPFLIVEGHGVLISEDITAAERAVLYGLMEVVRRIEAPAPIRYLTDQEVTGILSTDGRHYRASAENNARP